MRMMQDVLLLFSNTMAFLLALVFVRAALHKFGDRYRFQGILADYALLPEGLLAAATYAIPVVELGSAILLMVPTTRPLGAALAGMLLVAYAVAMAVSLFRGRYLMDCGCGDAPEPVSWLLVSRNALLAGLLSPAAFGLAGTTVSSLVYDVAALGTAVLLMMLWLAAEALFANARRIHETLPTQTQTWSLS